MLGLVNRPKDISLSSANQSQAKFKGAVGGNLLQSWVNQTIITTLQKEKVCGEKYQKSKILGKGNKQVVLGGRLHRANRMVFPSSYSSSEWEGLLPLTQCSI